MRMHICKLATSKDLSCQCSTFYPVVLAPKDIQRVETCRDLQKLLP